LLLKRRAINIFLPPHSSIENHFLKSRGWVWSNKLTIFHQNESLTVICWEFSSLKCARRQEIFFPSFYALLSVLSCETIECRDFSSTFPS
jgi:hypothetical protein